LPKSLVLRRWTRKAKEGISGYDDIGSLMEDSLAIKGLLRWTATLRRSWQGGDRIGLTVFQTSFTLFQLRIDINGILLLALLMSC
ncbi:hypothetical protein S83_055990, partial [Arachis hypogaea]